MCGGAGVVVVVVGGGGGGGGGGAGGGGGLLLFKFSCYGGEPISTWNVSITGTTCSLSLQVKQVQKHLSNL